ncbi:methyltransferase domain-containing protein [Luteimonas vadosa]|uniref:Arsenite methyltransferase n=1 Tax=Luteimonas vadosa TaxID=1165507 RepID=A0ABP9DW96_9GAMM
MRDEAIQQYYGSTLAGSGDLKTGACCSPDSIPDYLRGWLGELPREVNERFYGCGSPIPAAIAGATVLDLGCGTGRDAFLVSRLVGAEGRVIGLDMTPRQLEVARRAQAAHRDTTGLDNLDFRDGVIEDLAAAGIADASVDVVISNCVLNLSSDKSRVLAEVFRVLKPGGELFFADVYGDRRIPPELLDDPVLRGECLAGALYPEDFRRMLARLGVDDHRVVARSPVPLLDADIEARIGMIAFESLTVRAFKLELEDRCEDFGQFATYRGDIPHHPHRFVLDDHHVFERDRPMAVCGNTAAMLSQTRYAPHFEVSARRAHFGLFDCGPTPAGGEAGAAGCC